MRSAEQSLASEVGATLPKEVIGLTLVAATHADIRASPEQSKDEQTRNFYAQIMRQPSSADPTPLIVSPKAFT